METVATFQMQEGAFHHVLVCLDRSESAERALPLATYISATNHAQVTLLHVLDVPPRSVLARPTNTIEWEIGRTEARAYLEAVGRRYTPEARTCVVEGSAARQIVSFAEELPADLIAITSHGEGGAGDWNLGSTVEKILALTDRSVLITPTRAPGADARVPPRRILVPLDGARRTESVLPLAVRLARPAEAEIILAHVVWEPIRTEILASAEDLNLAHELAERETRNAEHYLERIHERLTADGVAARPIVRRRHDHREALVSLATSEQADLVLLCAHGVVCNARRPFGSVTRYMIAHASAPLLVLQDVSDRRRVSRSDSSMPRPRAPLPARATHEAR